MKIFLLSFLMLFYFLSLSANPGSVRGKVVDAGTREDLPYATVSVENPQTGIPVAGVPTDESGEFRIDNIDNGTYILRISMIGFTTLEREFTISASRPEVNLRTLPLSEDVQVLDEVVIEGIQSQMRFEIDRRVFNVAQNIASTGGSASDVLANIPSVEVDPEGEISLRGNASVTIWINGKASGLSADNRAQVLEQLPAESIERVELITNPSARYNPEGTAGIINIVLKRDRKAGYFGSIQAGADSRNGYNMSGNINYSSGKFESYLNIGHRVREREGRGYTYRNYVDDAGNVHAYLNQIRGDEEREWPYFGRAGITYHLTTKDHFSINTFGLLDFEKEDDRMDYSSNVPGSFVRSFRLSENENNMKMGNVEFNYRRDFSEKSNLDLTVSHHAMDREEESLFTQQSEFADGSESSSYQFQHQDNKSRSWEIQLDYVTEFGQQNKVEAGYKGDLSRTESPVETVSGPTEESAVFDEDLYNFFRYNQDVHALYATYSKRINQFGFQTGLRGEYTRMDTKSLAYGETEDNVAPYEDDYLSLYPSAFISYTLPGNNELQLNYTRRVSRPRRGQLNPFMNVMDSTNITYGNPYLTPQYSNALELNYIKSWDNHMVSTSLYYRNTADVIQRINYLNADNIMMSTHANVAKTQSAGVEFIVKNSLFGFLDLTSTLNLYYNSISGFSYLPAGAQEPVTGEADDDFSWNGRIVANAALPYDITMQVTGNYNSRQIISQGYTKPNGSVDIGFRKSFLNRALHLTLNGRDIFETRRRVTVTSGAGFHQENMFRVSGRTIGLTLTYSFGNMNGDRNNDRQQPMMDDEEF